MGLYTKICLFLAGLGILGALIFSNQKIAEWLLAPLMLLMLWRFIWSYLRNEWYKSKIRNS